MRSHSNRVSLRRIVHWLGILWLAPLLHTQTASDAPSTIIRSNVRLVQIDVIAKDKHGNPVPGLQEKDFTLLDDGVPQKIRRISVERSTEEKTSQPVPAATNKPPGPQTFSNTHAENVVPTVILFDALNTSVEDQPSMRKGLLQSLDRLKEGTPVALLILGEDLTVVSDFTSSTISLKKAVATGFNLRGEGFGSSLSVHRTGIPTIDRMIQKAAATAFHAENNERIVRTLAALHVICQALSPMRGRKSLLWITGGVSTPPGSTDVEDAIDQLNDANVAVYTVDARGVLMSSGTSAETDKNDVTQPLEIEREDTRGDVLFVVAAATGGITYRNTNRLDGAISRAMADRALVYVLDYYPTLKDWSGKLHNLRVKTSRPGVRLRYRTSYCATLPARPNAQEQQEMLASLASAPLDYAGIHFDVQIEPGPPSDPRFTLRVPASEVEWSTYEGKMVGSLQLWFIQKRANGEDLTTNQTKTDLELTSDAYDLAVKQGVTLATDLKLEAPAAKVRVMIRDKASGKIGTVDVPVEQNPSPRPPL